MEILYIQVGVKSKVPATHNYEDLVFVHDAQNGCSAAEISVYIL